LLVALDTVQPAKRTHVADHVFDELARAILEGELAPGSSMPPERVLVERFGVSRVLARQALHRLAELGLVRVRQGGATIVLDPNEVSDLRVLALFYRLAGSFGAIEIADIIEKQYLQGLSLVEVASRRASLDALVDVRSVLEDAAKEATTPATFAKLEERFWRALAAAGHNRIFKMEIAWWYETLADRPVPDVVANATVTVRLGFYQELVRRLIEKDDPVGYYLAATRPILDAVLGAK
jgi:GntR family transcriptional regulator, transcriptional repressor for pyruvate dehydrogenase complex